MPSLGAAKGYALGQVAPWQVVESGRVWTRGRPWVQPWRRGPAPCAGGGSSVSGPLLRGEPPQSAWLMALLPPKPKPPDSALICRSGRVAGFGRLRPLVSQTFPLQRSAGSEPCALGVRNRGASWAEQSVCSPGPGPRRSRRSRSHRSRIHGPRQQPARGQRGNCQDDVAAWGEAGSVPAPLRLIALGPG